MSHKPVLVNLGCGKITHSEWHNFDINPSRADVSPLLRDGMVPLASGTVDASYSSHVLEHIPRGLACSFLKEQARVLRSGGIIRVVVPDLEFLCRQYLSELERCDAAQQIPSYRYRHNVAELLDQLVRTPQECELVALWKNAPAEERDWVAYKIGYVAEGYLLDSSGGDGGCGRPAGFSQLSVSSIWALSRRLFRRAQECAASAATAAIGGQRLYSAFACGLYRSRGEVHQWMYDHVSLRQLLKDSGFDHIERRQLNESDIPRWRDYGLEVRGSRPLKPHSLVMEARKP